MRPYTIQLHRHRFAVWTAGRAVARNFASAKHVEAAITAAGLRKAVEADKVFRNQKAFDKWHVGRCEKMLKYWDKHSEGVKEHSFGRAAKVIAIYLKAMIGLGEIDAHPMQKWMHPPIDRILLDNMRTDLGYTIKELPNWTQLDVDGYSEVLKRISDWMQANRKGADLWEVEEFWAADVD
ncbi:MAG: hypothetical protein AB8F78_07015 [Saprospiraceae bacterium]